MKKDPIIGIDLGTTNSCAAIASEDGSVKLIPYKGGDYTVPSIFAVDDKGNENLRLSIRNMDANQFLPPEGVNVYDLLRHDHLVLSKGAVKALEARCLERKS